MVENLESPGLHGRVDGPAIILQKMWYIVN